MNTFNKSVFTAGLVAGVLDLSAAYISQYITTGKFAAKMLHYIAGGVLGLETALKGGIDVQALGLIIHFSLAMLYTLIFFWMYPKLKLHHYHKILLGALYGILVGMCMTFVVLPLTALPPASFELVRAIRAWLILAVALGIPISLFAHNYYSRRYH